MLDSSGSIERENFHYILEFTTEIIRGLNIGQNFTRASIVTFSNEAMVEISLEDYFQKYDLMHAINMIQYQGFSTYTDVAFHLTHDRVLTTEGGSRKDAENFIILVTDGEPTDTQAAFEAALSSRILGNNVMIVGIGMNKQQALVYDAIASVPQDKTVIGVKSIKDLSGVSGKVIQTLIDSKCQVLITFHLFFSNHGIILD